MAQTTDKRPQPIETQGVKTPCPKRRGITFRQAMAISAVIAIMVASILVMGIGVQDYHWEFINTPHGGYLTWVRK